MTTTHAPRNSSDLVRQRRIARACYLLQSTDLPVSRISAMSGYTNLASFNRRLRTETGTTPTAYSRGASPPEGAASRPRRPCRRPRCGASLPSP